MTVVSLRILLELIGGLKMRSSRRDASYIDFDAYSASSIVGSF